MKVERSATRRFGLRIASSSSSRPQNPSDKKPRDEPYGRVAVFVDVAGNRWDLLGPAR